MEEQEERAAKGRRKHWGLLHMLGILTVAMAS